MNHVIYESSYCSLRQGHTPYLHVEAMGNC
jgi:hypothetical protein